MNFVANDPRRAIPAARHNWRRYLMNDLIETAAANDNRPLTVPLPPDIALRLGLPADWLAGDGVLRAEVLA